MKWLNDLKTDPSARRQAVQLGLMFLGTAVCAAAQSTNIGRGLNKGWQEVQTWAYPIGGIGLLGSAAVGHWGEGGIKRHAGKGAIGSLVVLGVPTILNTLQQWSQ